jgi:Ni,Fe-hydrogenase III small subunit/NAD-dependent dihydropyrimidine dehydrogenase PreA subunit
MICEPDGAVLKIIRGRLRERHRTLPLLVAPVPLPERFRGLPVLDQTMCVEGCADCAAICPTGAIGMSPLRVDLGACLFCGACQEGCPEGAITYTPDYRLAARTRADLVVSDAEAPSVAALSAESRRLFGRSLKLRQVSAGGCGGCEAELVALGNVVFDLGRFGVQFVASPRHADGIVITGTVTPNMERALLGTYEAVPAPKLVIAVGACAISGGPFVGARTPAHGVSIPVDLYVPGCPPHPLTVLDGIVRLLGRLGSASRTERHPAP